MPIKWNSPLAVVVIDGGFGNLEALMLVRTDHL